MSVKPVEAHLFGADVAPERVIGETLVRATSAGDSSRAQLEAAVHRAAAGDIARGYNELAADSLAGWIESAFGLTTESETGALVRSAPSTVPAAAVDLSAASAVDAPVCGAAIRNFLLAGSQARHPDHGRPLFAFRLHQFVSKGDTVHVSLEPEGVRHITARYQLRVPHEPDKALLPLGFCRECGQEYYVVARAVKNGRVSYVPRHDSDASGGDAVTGYLYISSDHPWPVDPVAEGRLPDHWLVEAEDGSTTITPTKRKYLPMRCGWRRMDPKCPAARGWPDGSCRRRSPSA